MRHLVIVAAAAVAALLALASPSHAQSPVSPPGAYATEWAEFYVYIGPDGQAGTRTVDVVAVPPEPGGPSWEFRAGGVAFCSAWADNSVQCSDPSGGVWFGAVQWIDYPTGPDGALQTQWFVLDLESGSRTWGRRWELGTRQASAPPTPARAVTFDLREGQTVTGTVAVRMTSSGLGAGPYRWYISVDGRQVAFRNESATQITWWWNTGSLAPGTHVLSVRVVDAGGAEARGTVNVRK